MGRAKLVHLIHLRPARVVRKRSQKRNPWDKEIRSTIVINRLHDPKYIAHHLMWISGRIEIIIICSNKNHKESVVVHNRFGGQISRNLLHST
jgi:hypothetical protein